MSYSVIISVGMRCYTEIYLKQMGYKKFSCPFDAIFSNTIDDIIYLFENRIEYDKLIHTENIKHPTIQQLNDQYGLRTIHTQFNYYNERDYSRTYHLATFAHHNLNDDLVKGHYDRCFKRLDVIKERGVKTLFCLFNHPHLESNRCLSFENICKMKTYLSRHYNCHLLVVEFFTYNNAEPHTGYKMVYQDEELTYLFINNGNLEYESQKSALNHIFENVIKVDTGRLLTYEEVI